MTGPFCVWQDIYTIGSAEISHPLDCCIYLIDAGELVLIDAGAGKSFDYLTNNILALGLDPNKLDSVIVTHAHIDHIGALAYFKREYGIKIIAHELDAHAIESGKGIGAEFYGVDYQPCPIDTKLQGAECDLRLGKYEFKILHIPGHTPGSIAIYLNVAGKRLLFGQDIHGPYEVAWGSNLDQAITSLQKLTDIKADILCEGHFGIYQPAEEVRGYIENYLYQLQHMTTGKH